LYDLTHDLLIAVILQLQERRDREQTKRIEEPARRIEELEKRSIKSHASISPHSDQ
jgi:hypothetical protein